MTRTIRALVTRGVLAPLEPLDLPGGREVDITVAIAPTDEDVSASRTAAGGWRGKVDAEGLIRDVYTDRLLRTRPVPRLRRRAT